MHLHFSQNSLPCDNFIWFLHLPQILNGGAVSFTIWINFTHCFISRSEDTIKVLLHERDILFKLYVFLLELIEYLLQHLLVVLLSQRNLIKVLLHIRSKFRWTEVLHYQNKSTWSTSLYPSMKASPSFVVYKHLVLGSTITYFLSQIVLMWDAREASVPIWFLSMSSMSSISGRNEGGWVYSSVTLTDKAGNF